MRVSEVAHRGAEVVPQERPAVLHHSGVHRHPVALLEGVVEDVGDVALGHGPIIGIPNPAER